MEAIEKKWTWSLDWDQAYEMFEQLGEIIRMKELLKLNSAEKKSFVMDVNFDIEITEH